MCFGAHEVPAEVKVDIQGIQEEAEEDSIGPVAEAQGGNSKGVEHNLADGLYAEEARRTGWGSQRRIAYSSPS